MNSSNYLDVPQRAFGTSGINTANLVFEAAKSINSGAIIQYRASEKLIVIKNLGELTIQDLGKVLYSKERAPKYDGWYPKVEEQKDSDGNYLIKFSCFPPGDASSTPKSFYDSLTMPLISSQPKSVSREKTLVVEADLSKAVIGALTAIMSNPKKEFLGVWYPTDLKKFFFQKSEEMPEEYWDGYTSSEYFHKTGRFTFELKDGKSAAAAVNVLMAGPSVLDCGNATQLAYYKAILDVVGSEKFDALFSGDTLRLKITQNGITDSESPISYFSEYTSASKKRLTGKIGKRPLNIGEECHFKGLKFYANKHPTGFAGGWTVIYVGDNQLGEQLFVAHGFESSITEREINRLLVELYNRERTSEEIQYISENPNPSLHDKSVNSFLKMHYTVPIELKDIMVDGFLVDSCRGLKSDLVARVLEQEIDERFHLVLLNEKLASLI